MAVGVVEDRVSVVKSRDEVEEPLEDVTRLMSIPDTSVSESESNKECATLCPRAGFFFIIFGHTEG